ncbi:hypothetical protein [Lysinibacillus sphaericus]|uniref:Uncharacterized protein n=2 Tax=Lysinibacillus sphaericus TaxID=1421 RepID=A0A6G9ZZS2_LYSSH|nr:hypothetical protein [Lysinibacillus sphaericus]MBE5085713.1 hypothetical protein [Bacillus thuringiensis]ACA42277.1 hypothetical protein Bsph_p047 [Lysinibacillus sphaericus C3-41]AMO35420.1 hypothetical protein AR327_23295 [Lysinibacillus sphaericus]AMR93147.1 hypothetical protein A1T07_23360 [Lysinibacillus sphaericus]MBG9710672.1 hypothetical protein [Lysinibacillus sphaericus]
MEFIILLIILGSISILGVLPVVFAIRKEKKPSPWVIPTHYISPEQFNMQPPVSQLENVPKISESIVVETQEPVAISVDDFTASDLGEEIENNLEELLTEIKSENEELKDIRKKIEFFYSEKVAVLVTAVPGAIGKGEQIVYGILTSESKIEFEGNFVEICGEIPSNKDIGEDVIIKGNLLENGKFYSLHWEYPDMIVHGYSDDFNLSNESLGA